MKIIGHRGARNEAPENTVEGFVHASQNGCQHFELDIQLSADKELIIYHDKTLARTSGINEKLAKLSYKQLSSIDARENTPGWPMPCYIPKLEDVYLAVPDTLSWQFEVKTDRRDALAIIVDRLSKFIKQHDLYQRCHVTSTNKWFLQGLKARDPKIETGLVCEFLYQRPIKTCVEIGASLLALNERLATKSVMNDAKATGIEVSCWTVNTTKRIDQLRALGIESIITDLPTSLLKHYEDTAK